MSDMTVGSVAELAPGEEKLAPASPPGGASITLDVSGIGAVKARRTVETAFESAGLQIETREDVWDALAGGDSTQTRPLQIIVADLVHVLSRVRSPTAGLLPLLLQEASSFLVAVVRNASDRKAAAEVDELVRRFGHRIEVCEFSETALEEALTNVIAKADPTALGHIAYSKDTSKLWVEFGDGKKEAVDWAALALDQAGLELRPETVSIARDPRTVEILDSAGRTHKFETAILRAAIDEPFQERLRAQEADDLEKFEARLGARLRAKRKALGLRQEDIEGLQQALVSKLECDRHQPTYATLARYAEALDMTVAELLA